MSASSSWIGSFKSWDPRCVKRLHLCLRSWCFFFLCLKVTICVEGACCLVSVPARQRAQAAHGQVHSSPGTPGALSDVHLCLRSWCRFAYVFCPPIVRIRGEGACRFMSQPARQRAQAAHGQVYTSPGVAGALRDVRLCRSWWFFTPFSKSRFA